jgi:peptidoglycan/LPS O-acetylase OafA/YrhL
MGEKRVLALDGVRGLAILLVVVSHAGWPFLKFGGIAGVTLFFVLSGYLITGILAREYTRTEGVDLRSFYIRRARRLLPALALVLAFYVPLAYMVGIEQNTIWQGLSAALLYFANVSVAVEGWSLGPLGQTWSLAMEEQFYMVWPVLLVALLPKPRRWILGGLAAIVVLSLATRGFHGWSDDESYRLAYYMPWSNVFALAVGAALALIRLSSAPRHLGPICLFGLLAVAGPMGLINGLHSGENYGQRLLAGPIAAAFAAGVVWAAQDGQVKQLFEHRRLVWFGVISYGLYLWHGMLEGLASQLMSPEGHVAHLVIGTATAILATGVAWLSFTHLERRFRSDQAAASALRRHPPPAAGSMERGLTAR